jgi:hypothetical protein
MKKICARHQRDTVALTSADICNAPPPPPTATASAAHLVAERGAHVEDGVPHRVGGFAASHAKPPLPPRHRVVARFHPRKQAVAQGGRLRVEWVWSGSTRDHSTPRAATPGRPP